MSTPRSSLAQRASRLAGINSSPKAAPPTHRRLAAVGLAAVVVSLVADIVLAAAGRAVFTVPVSFSKFSFGSYGLLTVLGIAGATATWGAVTRLSSRPKWLLTRLAVLVSALFLIPDFLLLGTPANPTGPVVILMLMHLAIAAITYTALIKLAPVRNGLAMNETGQGLGKAKTDQESAKHEFIGLFALSSDLSTLARLHRPPALRQSWVAEKALPQRCASH